MRRTLGPILLISLGLVLVLIYVLWSSAPTDGLQNDGWTAQVTEPATRQLALSDVTPVLTANPTSQPIIPAATGRVGARDPDARPATPSKPSTTPDPGRCPLTDCLSRAGVSGRLEDIAAASAAGLPVGNFFDWWLNPDPLLMPGRPAGDPPRYWQMVPVNQDGPAVAWSRIDEVVAARLGAIWIVGNEPDVTWQDNTPAEAYATIYHDVYTFIKDRDPSAQIAIAGVAQPSPLRFAYLERVLETYRDRYGESMPVDIWTVHAFILREQAGSWGVDIPPGMNEEEGLLYEIADHDDLAIFQQSLFDFRSWMAQHGYGDKPLAVTEFGILHPADFGFPPEAVIAFMIGASDFMATASGDTGYPEDDHRLVQFWFWYSVHDHGDYPTGNLYDPENDRLTTVGQAYSRYLVTP